MTCDPTLTNLRDLDQFEKLYVQHFGKNSLFINGLPIDLDGYMQLVDENIILGIAANSSAPDLNKFLTLIPAIYTSDFASMQTKGSGTLNVTLEGTYNDQSFPAYDMKVNVNNGYFKKGFAIGRKLK